MKDGTSRRIIKRVALWRYVVDLWVTRRVMTWRREDQYYLKGECNRCGRCCEHPTIQMNEWSYHLAGFRKAVILWHEKINGFRLAKVHKTDAQLVFTCTHYDLKSRRCDSWSSRPGMCRDYPAGQIFSVNPVFFDECGYYAVDKRAESFRNALEITDLSQQKLDDLFRRLHLKD